MATFFGQDLSKCYVNSFDAVEGKKRYIRSISKLYDLTYDQAEILVDYRDSSSYTYEGEEELLDSLKQSSA